METGVLTGEIKGLKERPLKRPLGLCKGFMRPMYRGL